MITFNYLMAQALIVLNAKLKKENSAKRVGGLFRDLLLYFQNLILGIILKGEKDNEAAIKAIVTPEKGDTYKAKDTNFYWTFDGKLWNNIGDILPADAVKYTTLMQGITDSVPFLIKTNTVLKPAMQADSAYFADFAVSQGNQTYKSCFFKSAGGARLKIAGNFNINVIPVLYFDKYKKLISTVPFAGITNPAEVVTPTGTEYVAVNVYDSSNTGVNVTYLTDAMISNTNVEQAKEAVGFVPAGYDITRTLGFHSYRADFMGNIGKNGVYTPSANPPMYVTDFIKIADGKKLNFKVNLYNTNTMVGLYDYRKRFVRTLGNAGGVFESSIVGGTDGIQYIRLCSQKNYGMYMWYDEDINIKNLIEDSLTIPESEKHLQESGTYQTNRISLTESFKCSTEFDPNMSVGKSMQISSGDTGTNPNAMTTDYIAVSKGSYRIEYSAAGTLATVLYDKYKRHKKGFDVIGGALTQTGGIIEVTDEAFVRICGWKGTPIHLYSLENKAIKKQPLSPYDGKKLVTIGDSNVQQKSWQKLLCETTGMIYSSLETDGGVGKHWELPDGTRLAKFQDGAVEIANAPMGLAGTGVRNLYLTKQADLNNINWTAGWQRTSIAERSRDARYYNPDVILIYGDANDFSIATNTPQTNVLFGSIADAPYMGAEKLISSWYEQGTGLTLYSSYKGMLQQLCKDNPNAKIACVSVVPWRYDTEENAAKYDAILKRLNTMIRECAAFYNIEYIDLYSTLGWNHYNNMENYGTPASDREVHPNNLGQAKVVAKLAQYFK